MTVMNVQSTSKGLDDLLYYVVPATWYRQAWRLLLKPGSDIPADWREQIGELDPVRPWWDGAGEDDQEVNQQKADVMKEMRSAWKQPSSATAAKHPKKEHEKDYYFVGQNSWGVLENKFGKASGSADGVSCHVVSLPSQDSRLAVNLPDGQRIAIPGSGRFAYEESLDKDGDADKTMDEVRVCGDAFLPEKEAGIQSASQENF